MSEAIMDPLEQIIRDSNEGWLIDWFAPREEALAHLRSRLTAVDDAARHRLGGGALRLTPESIVQEYRTNPRKVRAFIQVLGAVETPHILLMVWRILQGFAIQAIELNYQSEQSFHMRLVLRSPYGEADEIYDSDDVDDAVVLRHFGIMKMGDAPVMDGFFALNVGN